VLQFRNWADLPLWDFRDENVTGIPRLQSLVGAFCFIVITGNDALLLYSFAFSALTLLVGQQEGNPACKNTEWWCAGVVICLERGAEMHMVQLMPLPLTVSCFSKIQIGFMFLVLAHPSSLGQRAVKWVCV